MKVRERTKESRETDRRKRRVKGISQKMNEERKGKGLEKIRKNDSTKSEERANYLPYFLCRFFSPPSPPTQATK